ncbi:MAG: P-loop NTPase fold protein [Planctomycetota bacterium]|nr:P-loop NTPase fold protein [Planctomycetota bacterium]
MPNGEYKRIDEHPANVNEDWLFSSQKSSLESMQRYIRENSGDSTGAKDSGDSNRNSAHSIAFFGGWGSGKSTVIEKLRKNPTGEKDPETDEKTFFMVFDAWEHKGDGLRIAFLERMRDEFWPKDTESACGVRRKIDAFTNGMPDRKPAYGKASKEANRHYKDTTQRQTEVSVSWCKLIVGVIAIIFAACMGWLFAQWFPVSTPPLPNGLLEAFLTFAFLVVIAWSASTTVQERESCSYDFQQAVKQTLRALLCDDHKYASRAIIVIDNLDRLDEEEAREAWGTLQSVLYVNSLEGDGHDDFLSKVFLIAPMNEEMARRAWSTKEEVGDNGANNSESYIQKTFAQQYEITEPTRDDIGGVFGHLFDQAKMKPSEGEKETIVSMFMAATEKPYTVRKMLKFVNKMVDAAESEGAKQTVPRDWALYACLQKPITLLIDFFYDTDSYCKPEVLIHWQPRQSYMTNADAATALFAISHGREPSDEALENAQLGAALANNAAEYKSVKREISKDTGKTKVTLTCSESIKFAISKASTPRDCIRIHREANKAFEAKSSLEEDYNQLRENLTSKDLKEEHKYDFNELDEALNTLLKHYIGDKNPISNMLKLLRQYHNGSIQDVSETQRRLVMAAAQATLLRYRQKPDGEHQLLHPDKKLESIVDSISFYIDFVSPDDSFECSHPKHLVFYAVKERANDLHVYKMEFLKVDPLLFRRIVSFNDWSSFDEDTADLLLDAHGVSSSDRRAVLDRITSFHDYSYSEVVSPDEWFKGVLTLMFDVDDEEDFFGTQIGLRPIAPPKADLEKFLIDAGTFCYTEGSRYEKDGYTCGIFAGTGYISVSDLVHDEAYQKTPVPVLKNADSSLISSILISVFQDSVGKFKMALYGLLLVSSSALNYALLVEYFKAEFSSVINSLTLRHLSPLLGLVHLHKLLRSTNAKKALAKLATGKATLSHFQSSIQLALTKGIETKTVKEAEKAAALFVLIGMYGSVQEQEFVEDAPDAIEILKKISNREETRTSTFRGLVTQTFDEIAPSWLPELRREIINQIPENYPISKALKSVLRPANSSDSK